MISIRGQRAAGAAGMVQFWLNRPRRSRCPQARAADWAVKWPGGQEQGFALVDALVALTILSTTLILALSAARQADNIAKAAWEVREAHTLVAKLIDTARIDLGQEQLGQANGFSWRVETQAIGAERPIPICRRSAVVTHNETGRKFSAAIVESCPVSSPA